ncbi:MAG: SufD family Fe-S cluster assembly protein [Opitutales bacterium]|nr:SufD family Fe-S cluster assembly protein [Opitutales bacterium]
MDVSPPVMLPIGQPQPFGTWEKREGNDCFCFNDGYISERYFAFEAFEVPLYIRLGKNTRVAIIEQGSDVHYTLEENSSLLHLSEPRSYKATFDLDKEAHLRHVSVGTVRENLKNTLVVHLNGTKASVDWKDGLHLKASAECDWQMLIFHHAPQTSSNCRVHSVIEDKGFLRLTYDGTVEQSAADAVLLQKNLNYILTPNGRVCARPLMHIANKNVRASHGTATQPLPREVLFYLQARGLEPETAKCLFLEGFLYGFSNEALATNAAMVTAED